MIISSPERVARKPELNILMCSSQRATRAPNENEVILDTEDGLNWPTLCKCDLIHMVHRDLLTNQRGKVTAERRRQIIRTLNQVNDWIL